MTARELATELLSTTLALESSMAAEQFDEAPALIEKRASLLDRLERLELEDTDRALLATVRAIDDRLTTRFSQLRSAALHELAKGAMAAAQIGKFRSSESVGASIDRCG